MFTHTCVVLDKWFPLRRVKGRGAGVRVESLEVPLIAISTINDVKHSLIIDSLIVFVLS